MTSNENTISAQITADVSGLVAGMKDAGGATSAATRQMETDLAGLGAAAEQTSEHAEGLLGHIRSMRQEMFIGNFMARQITEIGAASKETAGLVAGLAGAFLVGNWTGLAIEGALKLVSALHEVYTEELKQKELLAQLAIDTAKSIAGIREAVDKIIGSIEGATRAEVFFRDTVIPAMVEVEKAKNNVAAAQKLLTDAEREATPYIEANYQTQAERSAALEAMTKKEREEVERLTAVLASKQKMLGEAKTGHGKIEESETASQAQKQGEDALKADQKAAAEREKIAKEHKVEMLRLAAEAATGEEKITADYAVKLQGIRDKDKLGEQKKQEEIAALSKVYVQQINDFRDKAEKEAEKQHKDHLNRLIDAEAKAAESIRKLLEHQDAQRAEIGRTRSESDRKIIDQQVADAERLGAAFGSAFAGIADGTLTVGKAFADMAKAVVKTLLDQAIAGVKANAALAGSEAAASQAGVPIAGPVLAVAAMTAIEAAVLGLLSALPSAAGGWEIPTSVGSSGVLMIGHGGEKMLPADKSAKLDSMLDRGGAGSGARELHLHIHALDGQDAYRFFARPETQRSLRELARNGLLPVGG